MELILKLRTAAIKATSPEGRDTFRTQTWMKKLKSLSTPWTGWTSCALNWK